MSRYTIEPEGEQYRVKWNFKIGKYPWNAEPCGLFARIEQARESLSSMSPTAPARRKFPEALAEYGN